MRVIEVFADIACPFTHVGLRRIRAYRRERGNADPLLRVHAWPLELVNGAGLQGSVLAPKISALRAEVAPDLFGGFVAAQFPQTMLPALAVEAAAYRDGIAVGERFSFAARTALFERGLDVSNPDVLRALREETGVAEPSTDDELAVRLDFEDGKRREVAGSPHFFTARGDYFCPSLDIEHSDGRLEVSFDAEGFADFMSAAFD